MVRDLILSNRSCRRFDEGFVMERRTLEELVDLARLSASAANLQPLKYVLSCDAEKNARIFPHLAWAAYLKDWGGPAPGERPSAYLVILGDSAISQTFGCDHGIAAQSILLAPEKRGWRLHDRADPAGAMRQEPTSLPGTRSCWSSLSAPRSKRWSTRSARMATSSTGRDKRRPPCPSRVSERADHRLSLRLVVGARKGDVARAGRP
jgi:hypothetical protein